MKSVKKKTLHIAQNSTRYLFWDVMGVPHHRWWPQHLMQCILSFWMQCIYDLSKQNRHENEPNFTHDIFSNRTKSNGAETDRNSVCSHTHKSIAQNVIFIKIKHQIKMSIFSSQQLLSAYFFCIALIKANNLSSTSKRHIVIIIDSSQMNSTICFVWCHPSTRLLTKSMHKFTSWVGRGSIKYSNKMWHYCVLWAYVTALLLFSYAMGISLGNSCKTG